MNSVKESPASLTTPTTPAKCPTPSTVGSKPNPPAFGSPEWGELYAKEVNEAQLKNLEK